MKYPATALFLILAISAAFADSPRNKNEQTTEMEKEKIMTLRQSRPLSLDKVTIEDSFWQPRMRTNREVTMPFQYRKFREAGHLDAFDLSWKPGANQRRCRYYDSDVAKWVEAMGYSQITHPDPKGAAMLDEVASLFPKAQSPDGYINTFFSALEPQNIWTNLVNGHELYCAGHIIEAAIAHHRATGNAKLLDAARRFADLADKLFGSEPGKKRSYCGHPEIEMALVKLYNYTGERRYLDLSKFFVNERGRQPNCYDQEAEAHGKDVAARRVEFDNYEYMQAHKPLREQTEVIGHSVRAMYIYSAMTDLAMECNDKELLAACRRLYENLVSKRLYVHGGIGSSGHNEGFTADYDLPNDSAYAESCASIGLVFWSHRMLQLDCDGRYSDTMERALYNGILSGCSLKGDRFFYVNSLSSKGDYHREEWFPCVCCPPNYSRLLASLGKYVYAHSESEAVIHLYIRGSGSFDLGGQLVVLRQETEYPWDGKVAISIETPQPVRFALKLRIPGWSRGFAQKVNGKLAEAQPDKGYVRLERHWKNGDRVELDIPMRVERVSAHPAVQSNLGRVAIQRGPVLYCLEQADNAEPLSKIVLTDDAGLSAKFSKDLLDGVVTITGKASVIQDADWGATLYRHQPLKTKPCRITAIPYYAWDNRAPGEMLVWMRSQGL